jgi:hypothetical protein
MGAVYKVKFINDNEEMCTIRILATGFIEAVGETLHYLQEDTDYETWEIVSIKLQPKINIMNFLNDNEDNQSHWEGDVPCPFCAADDCDPLLTINYICDNCGNPDTVMDNNWTSIFCRACGKRMTRENFKFVDNEWVYIDSENEGKEE